MISESRPYGYYSLLHTPRDANKQYLALAYIARYESNMSTAMAHLKN